MENPVHIFYYSRKKLGLYLVFNIILLTMAVLFTLTIFPEFPLAYYFALGSCLLSVLAALFVFLWPMRLAVITPQSIKIDRCEPLNWCDIHSVRKVKVGKGLFCKNILKLNTGKLPGYHMNLIQKLSDKSQFGAFSIPLYAMDKKSTQEIEKLIRRFKTPTKPKMAKKKITAHKKP